MTIGTISHRLEGLTKALDRFSALNMQLITGIQPKEINDQGTTSLFVTIGRSRSRNRTGKGYDFLRIVITVANRVQQVAEFIFQSGWIAWCIASRPSDRKTRAFMVRIADFAGSGIVPNVIRHPVIPLLRRCSQIRWVRALTGGWRPVSDCTFGSEMLEIQVVSHCVV